MLESSWLMYKEVKVPQKNISKGSFKTPKYKITEDTRTRYES